ncbi:MAG: hypothetical protein SGI74_03695 [Oligoflexia bacterium]|nr:hypothetical protein [Oligoflexia bacterium]
MLSNILMTLVIFASTANAATIVINDERCVPHSALKVHGSITNYAAYKDIDGSYATRDTIPFDFNLRPFVKIAAIDMTKSQSKTNPQLPTPPRAPDTNDIVLVELRPVASDNTAIFPKLVMNCTSKWTNDKTFNHQCKLLPQYPHFALDDFSSELITQERATSCPNGSALKYTLTIVSNSLQIDLIKEEAMVVFQKKWPLVPKDLIRAGVNNLFKEEDFFRTYYTGFYERWVASIKNYILH